MITFTKPIRLEHCVGSKIITHIRIGDSIKKEYNKLHGIITGIHDGKTRFGVPNVYLINIDNGNYYWFKEQLELIR